MLSSIIQTLYILLFSLLQTSFISGLPEPLRSFQLSLCLVVFWMLLDKRNLMVYAALLFAFFLEGDSVIPTGFSSIAFLVSIWIGYKIYIRFITNKTLYSLLLLITLTTLIFEIIMRIVHTVLISFHGTPVAATSLLVFSQNTLLETFLHILFLTILYSVTLLVTKQLRLYFIVPS